MNNDHSHDSSKFFNGFLFGMLIGGAAIFFLGTQKGKKFLKKLSEDGIESFSEFEDLVEEANTEYENLTTEPIVSKDVIATKKETTPTTKRFFKKPQ